MAVITAKTGARNWGTATDWVGDVLPSSSDSAVIPSTITMNLDGAYPAAGAGFLGITVQSGGILELPVAANWSLKLSGDKNFTIASGGTIRMVGGGALAAGNTGYFSFTPATDGGSGFVINGTATIKGATKDHFVLLGADIGQWAASADVATTGGNITTITTSTAPSGWLDGDLIAVTPTGITYSHWDTCLLNGAPVGTALTVDGWNGTAPTYTSNDGVAGKSAWNHQGEGLPTEARAAVLNLSRNIKIYSTDNTKRANITIAAGATVTLDSVELYSVGSSAGQYAAIVVSTTAA